MEVREQYLITSQQYSLLISEELVSMEGSLITQFPTRFTGCISEELVSMEVDTLRATSCSLHWL